MNTSLAEARAILAKPKVQKFRNVKTVVDGHSFDSKKESIRWGELQIMERAGEIRFLRNQVRFPLIVGETTVAHYVSDFAYVRESDGVQIIEDVKSAFTRKDRVYRLKTKIMSAMGLTVVEV